MARRFVLWDVRMQMDRQRKYREISDPYNNFYHRYWVFKEDIPYLVNEICQGLQPNTRRSRPVPVDHKLLLTLKYLASNYFQNSVGDGQSCQQRGKKSSNIGAINENYVFQNDCRHPFTCLVCRQLHDGPCSYLHDGEINKKSSYLHDVDSYIMQIAAQLREIIFFQAIYNRL